MSEASDLLSSLRDIVEPPPPATTSPWLVLATLGLTLLLIVALVRRLRQRRNAWRSEALGRVRTASGATPDQALLECARVLRQVMRYRDGSAADALHGEEWLGYLASEFGDEWFTTGEGRIFGEALYSPEATTGVDVERLCSALAARLKRLPTKRQPAGSGASSSAGRS